MNDKRLRIILAAREEFEDKGYHEAKIADIAKKAEVGKGTVYEYFDSKQTLFEEMIMFLIDYGFNQMNLAFEKIEDPVEKLRFIAKMESQLMQEHGQLFSLILVRLASSSDSLKQKYYETRVKNLAIIEGIINDGIEKGIFKEMNANHFSLIFKGAMMQANMHGSCAPFDNHPEDNHLKHEIFDILISSILA